MRTRLQLQEMLENLMRNDHVYYRPPASVKMKYPAIVYRLSGFDNKHANNKVYKQMKRYTLTIIDKKPDNPVIDILSTWPLCSFDRHYEADGLNYDVFTLYF